MTAKKNPEITGKLYAPLPQDTASEQWRNIVDYDGLYLVSSLGRVYSIRRRLFNRSSPTKKGYLKVSLTKEGKLKTWFIHVLIAEVFLGPCPEGMEVNHKDGVKTRNHSGNLEYKTHRYNIQHAWDNDLRKNRVSTATITPEQVPEIQKLWEEIPKEMRRNRFGKLTERVPRGARKELADRFGVCPHQIYAIVKGTSWISLARE